MASKKEKDKKQKRKDHAKNVARLKALGVTDEFIQSELNTLKYGSGKHVNKEGEYERMLQAWNSRQPVVELNVPDFLKNDPAFNALSRDQQEIIIYNYNIQIADNAEDARKLGEALESAKAQAEPYWQNIIAIAQDEVLRNFEIAEGDYNSSVERQQRIIENINQDLSKNKDFLSLEQQSELATLARNYEINHESLVESAAGAGLTFSTKRKIAEKRLNEENQGLVESTTRSYNKQIADLQTEADRGNVEAQKEIENLQRKLGETKTSIGRAAEKYLGTSNLPTLEGYNPISNVTGDLYEQKTADIEARKDALYNEATSGSLDLSI